MISYSFSVVADGNTGVVVGVVMGCIVLLIIIGALVYWFWIRKMRDTNYDSNTPIPSSIYIDVASRAAGRRNAPPSQY